jgi:hypothetical protein
MPWCPNCRAEYRAGFTHCAKCQTALVEEAPAPPPRVAGWLVEEKTAASLQKLLPFRRDFRAGMETAREAMGLIWGAKKLMLLVLLLMLLSFLGSVAQTQVVMSQFRKSNRDFSEFQFPDTTKPSLAENWLRQFRSHGVSGYLVGDFDAPLAKYGAPFTSWLATLDIAIVGPKIFPQNQPPISWRILFGWWPFPLTFFLGFFLNAFIIVGLLGWLQAAVKKKSPEPWRAYWKAHYWPVLVFNVCYVLALQIIFVPVQLQYELRNAPVLGTFSAWLSDFAIRPLIPLIQAAVVLAPFMIVAQGLGAWSGVKAGVRRLWEKKWALLAIFLCYRVIYEIVQIIMLALPSPGGPGIIAGLRMQASPPMWFSQLATTFLGLWLAMSFILLVQPKVEPETALEADSAPA